MNLIKKETETTTHSRLHITYTRSKTSRKMPSVNARFLCPGSRPFASSALDTLGAGDVVKICVANERFWVRLTDVRGDVLKGTVDEMLLGDYGFDAGDTVAFVKNNVLDIYDPHKVLGRFDSIYRRAVSFPSLAEDGTYRADRADSVRRMWLKLIAR